MDGMKIRERVKLNGKYVTIHRETSADIVVTSDGSNVQEKLDGVQGLIDGSIQSIDVIAGGNASNSN